MKILALVGSNRKHGNTAGIVGLIEARVRALAAQRDMPLEFETLTLGELDIQPCRGCRRCFDPACTFYMAHRSHPVKIALARLADAIVFRFLM